VRIMICGGLAALLASSALEARTLTVDDYDRIRSVSAPSVDPSGQWVAYSVGSVDKAKDKSFSHLWMTSWDGRRTLQLTGRKDESESLPRWSPDGHFLAFISSRDDSKDRDQLWLLDRTGGEARQLSNIDGSVLDYVWSPDARSIALIVFDRDPDDPPGDAKKDDDSPPKPIVIDRFQFKQDIDGYLGVRRQRLMLLDVATGKARRLTTGDYNEYLPAWSPDGSRIAFTSNRDPDPDRTYNSDLWVVGTSGEASAPKRLTSFAGSDNDPDTESYPAWSPDGRQIAYIHGGPVELFYYGTRRLAVVAADGGPPRILTATLDRNVAQPIWSKDGKSIDLLVEDDRTQWLGRVSATGGPVTRLAGGRSVFESIDQFGQGRVAALVSDPSRPAEIYAVEGGKLRALSNHNAWLAEVQLAPVEDTSFASKDGTEIHGFLLKPVSASKGSAPTVLRMHGGPQSLYTYTFSMDWQLLAAHGYAVVAANPRGSTGRGQEFGRAIYAAWGGVDVPDVLGAVDDAVARGIADPNRLGLGGWSYGGMLTNYVIASDRRFKAATSGASISNMFAGYGTDQYIRDYEMELGKPWENMEAWLKVSYPFFHVDRISTPTLFLAGEKDFNLALLNSEQMYQALRSRGVDTKLIIYPGQFHSIKRPSFVRDRAQRYLDWYAKYLHCSAGQYFVERSHCGGRIDLSPDRLANSEKIGAGRDQRRRIVRRNPADGDAGDLEDAGPPAQDRRVRPIVRRLGRGRVEGAEGDIIGTGFARLHRQMPTVVAGPADLCRRSKQGPRFANVAILLAEMDAIGAEPLGQRHAVVDDECGTGVGAEPLQGLGQAGKLMLADVFHAHLESSHRPRCQGGLKPVGKPAADLLRADQIELRRLRPLWRREDRQVGCFVIHGRCISERRSPVQ